ncbi:MAG: chorismate synthase [Chloracidobacterium sp.]|uniref:Chorismate synthase n=1 Tax=Chloracidobacterium validum TaxID=2821543 RepID=A0ABX8B8H6_9BACT|nr:chorismate synthase [Chloracidobacterium validum]QUW03252.1 chorismate synthase [Chloracidobacterium validum]
MLRFITAGESHGPALVTIVEGLPAGLPIDIAAVNAQLRRRQLGYGRGGRMKIEQDRAEVLSGLRHGRTLGSPVALLIRNADFENWQTVMASQPTPDWEAIADDPKKSRRLTRPRPGHADLAGGLKFATHDLRDILERASARETAARVAAGALARQMLAVFGVEVVSHVIRLGGIPADDSLAEATWEQIVAVQESTVLRCIDPVIEAEMVAAVDAARERGDTLGGTFEVVVRGLPVGLGTHTQWDLRLDGRLAQAMMSIQAVKAVEIGAGVAVAHRSGAQLHDEIAYDGRGFTRPTNHAGGLEGGITNGQLLRLRGHLKPISTLRRALQSVDVVTKEAQAAAFERSDTTAVPAAGVIAEAMTALVLAQAWCEKFGGDSLVEMQRNVEGYRAQTAAY